MKKTLIDNNKMKSERAIRSKLLEAEQKVVNVVNDTVDKGLINKNGKAAAPQRYKVSRIFNTFYDDVRRITLMKTLNDEILKDYENMSDIRFNKPDRLLATTGFTQAYYTNIIMQYHVLPKDTRIKHAYERVFGEIAGGMQYYNTSIEGEVIAKRQLNLLRTMLCKYENYNKLFAI